MGLPNVNVNVNDNVNVNVNDKEKEKYKEKEKQQDLPQPVSQSASAGDVNSLENDFSLSDEKQVEPLKAKKEKEPKHKYGEFKNVLLTDREIERLKNDFENWEELIDYLSNYREMKGYSAKSDNLAIRNWVIKAVKEKKIRQQELEKREVKLTTQPGKIKQSGEEKRNYIDFSKFYAN